MKQNEKCSYLTAANMLSPQMVKTQPSSAELEATTEGRSLGSSLEEEKTRIDNEKQ